MNDVIIEKIQASSKIEILERIDHSFGTLCGIDLFLSEKGMIDADINHVLTLINNIQKTLDFYKEQNIEILKD